MPPCVLKFIGRVGFIGLLLLIISPSLWLTSENHIGLSPDECLVVVTASIFSLMLVIAPYRQWPRATVAFMALLAVLALPQLAFISEYGWPIDANALSLIAETNPAEAADIVGSIPLSSIAALAMVGLLTTTAWSRPPPARWPGKRLAIYGAFGFGCINLLAYLSGGAAAATSPDSPFSPPAEQQALALRGAYPAGVPWVVADYFMERRALVHAFKLNQSFRFGISKASSSPHRRVYVLVIGETTRADRWGLNGYARNTTPLLSQRPEIVSFNRMYSASTFSRLAVPLLISRKPPGLGSATFKEASIVTVFKEAGFHTAWVSLQAPVGFHESPISVHAYEADEMIFLNPTDYRSHGQLDGAAIPALERVLSAAEDHDTFVIIHTLGSHFRYTDRYPVNFARFLPDRPSDRAAQLFRPEDREVLSNAYDNTIAYIDVVLNSIIGKLQARAGTESWMLYASDHGEALFDDCRMLSGHGQFASQTQSVAALFWPSLLYARNHPDRVDAMRQHQTSLVSTAMVFETITSLAGFTVPGNRTDNSLAEKRLRLPVEVLNAEAGQLKACPNANRMITQRK